MSFTLLHEIPTFHSDRYPNPKAFNEKVNGVWQPLSIQEFIQRKNAIAHHLLISGAEMGDQIVISTEFGSANWLAIDMACLSIGLVVIPIFPSYEAEDLEFIFSEIHPTFIFCANEGTIGKLKPFDKKARFVSMQSSMKYDNIQHWLSKYEQQDILSSMDKLPIIKEEQLATIIYTSGSTGLPKGVMLSHRNIVSNIKAIITMIPINHKHVVASFLPMNHIFERMVVYTYMVIGVSIHFIQDSGKILQNIQEIRPHFMSSVPRILERLHTYITKQMKEAKMVKKFLIKLATDSGSHVPKHWYKYPKWYLGNMIAEVFVYRKWRQSIGGRVHGVIVGASAMDPNLAMLYTKADIPIKEGYGMTETSPVVAFNRFEPGGTKFGTVGIPIPSVEVKIEKLDENEDGEILVKGPNVMLGYYNNEALTKEKIDEEGWFRTGDLGHFEDDNFLKITGRKSEIFKTSSGQYVYPKRIEDVLLKTTPIDQVMVVGLGKPYVAALIVPDFEYLLRWCAANNVHWTSPLYMVLNDEVLAMYQRLIDESNTQLKSVERVRKFLLVSEGWTIDSKLLTPTYKLKRKQITAKYQKAIEELY